MLGGAQDPLGSPTHGSDSSGCYCSVVVVGAMCLGAGDWHVQVLNDLSSYFFVTTRHVTYVYLNFHRKFE